MLSKTKAKGATGRRSIYSDLRMDYDLYLMLLVPFLFLIVFKYIPMGGQLMAFQEYDIFEGFFNSPFVGLANFQKLFETDEFFMVLRNTLLISVYKILFYFPIPILMAILLNEVIHSVYKRTVQTIIYLPHFLSWVVVSGLVFDLLSTNGTINRILVQLGGKHVNFLMTPSYFRSIIVLSAIWKEVGYGSIVFLAAMNAIDPTLYEAAVIDGASRLRQIWHITIPGISSMIVVMLLLRIGTIMDANSEQILALYNPTVYETGDVLGTYIYRMGLSNMQYSFAAAAGIFNSLVSFTLVVIGNFFSRKIAHRSLW
jgi:putative aldouronate transport system permease protein